MCCRFTNCPRQMTLCSFKNQGLRPNFIEWYHFIDKMNAAMIIGNEQPGLGDLLLISFFYSPTPSAVSGDFSLHSQNNVLNYNLAPFFCPSHRTYPWPQIFWGTEYIVGSPPLPPRSRKFSHQSGQLGYCVSEVLAVQNLVYAH